MPGILIVDDEADVTEMSVLYFKNNGYDIYGAKNSEEAFKVIEGYKPDVLIIDINLQEKYSGLDVLKKALKVNPNAQIAMLTGLKDGSPGIQKSLTYGAKIIVEKPITITKLKEIVDDLLKNVSLQKKGH